MGTIKPRPPKAKSTQSTHLLIDGDVVAFMAASAVNHHVEDDFGYIWPFACKAEGEHVVRNIIQGLKVNLQADTFEVVISDPKENWRKLVDETYKTNRKDSVRPLLLGHLKMFLEVVFGAYWWPGLEADDVLGIKMTTPDLTPGPLSDCTGGCKETGLKSCHCLKTSRKVILVGRDKDFNSIPGFHHGIKQDMPGVVREISQWEADRFHLVQALAGDMTDGYPGCPGIGMASAEKIIDNPVRLVPQEGVKTRGKNKGEAVTRWMSEPTRDYWACIVSHYRKAGLTEADALKTARLARILRHGEYDRETEEVTLWTPDMIPTL